MTQLPAYSDPAETKSHSKSSRYTYTKESINIFNNNWSLIIALLSRVLASLMLTFSTVATYKRKTVKSDFAYLNVYMKSKKLLEVYSI